MKRMILKGALLAALIASTVSCLPDREYMYTDTGMCTVLGTVKLKNDNGDIYNVTENQTGGFIPDSLERVMIRCEVISATSGKSGEYDIRLNEFMPALVATPLPVSGHDEEAVGHDGINVTQAWVSGGYLNTYVNLTVKYPSDAEHDFNLLYDDVKSSADTLYLEVRHNAHGECPENPEASMASLRIAGTYLSFPLDGIFPSSGKKPVVHLAWDWYRDDNLYNPQKMTYSGDIIAQ